MKKLKVRHRKGYLERIQREEVKYKDLSQFDQEIRKEAEERSLLERIRIRKIHSVEKSS